MPNDTPISDRELEILRLVATGASNQQIAEQLSISANTVKVHLRNIFSKIGVVSRTEATVFAIRNGLVTVPAEGEVALAAAEPQAEAAPAERPPAPELPGLAEPQPAREAVAPPAPDGATARPAAAMTRRLLALVAALAVVVALALAAAPLLRGAAQPATPTEAAALAPQPGGDQRWLDHTAMPNPRDGFALAAYDQERRLYVIGGRDQSGLASAVDRYDPGSDRWTSVSAKPTPVVDAGAAVLRGSIYMPGGEDAGGEVRDILEIYDPRAQRWEAGPPMPAPRSRYALAVFEGRLYVIGGWDGAQSRGEVFIYDPENQQWRDDGPPLPSPRQSAGAVAASGWIYLIGGNDQAGALDEALRLDPTNSGARWDEIARLPQAVAAPGVVAPVGLILAFDPAGRVGYQYDQDTYTWSTFAIPDNVAISARAVMLGPSVYLVGGATTDPPGAISEYQAVFTTFLPGR